VGGWVRGWVGGGEGGIQQVRWRCSIGGCAGLLHAFGRLI
jgi:hypothetical protein